MRLFTNYLQVSSKCETDQGFRLCRQARCWSWAAVDGSHSSLIDQVCAGEQHWSGGVCQTNSSAACRSALATHSAAELCSELLTPAALEQPKGGVQTHESWRPSKCTFASTSRFKSSDSPCLTSSTSCCFSAELQGTACRTHCFYSCPAGSRLR